MLYLSEENRDFGVVGNFGGRHPYQLYTLKPDKAMAEYEVVYRIERLVQEESSTSFKKSLGSFEEVMFWCASFVDTEATWLIENIIHSTFKLVDSPLVKHILSTREGEIKFYREYYEKLKKQKESCMGRAVGKHSLLKPQKNDMGFYRPYIFTWSNGKEEYGEYLIESMCLTDQDVFDIADRIVYKVCGGSAEKCMEILLDEKEFFGAYLTELTLKAFPIFGLIPFTQNIFLHYLPIAAEVVNKDIHDKYSDEVKTIIVSIIGHLKEGR